MTKKVKVSLQGLWMIKNKYLNLFEQTKVTNKLDWPKLKLQGKGRGKGKTINYYLSNHTKSTSNSLNLSLRLTPDHIYLLSIAEVIIANHTRNDCRRGQYVYNRGESSSSTLSPYRRRRNNWQDNASTEILWRDHAWPMAWRSGCHRPWNENVTIHRRWRFLLPGCSTPWEHKWKLMNLETEISSNNLLDVWSRAYPSYLH